MSSTRGSLSSCSTTLTASPLSLAMKLGTTLHVSGKLLRFPPSQYHTQTYTYTYTPHTLHTTHLRTPHTRVRSRSFLRAACRAHKRSDWPFAACLDPQQGRERAVWERACEPLLSIVSCSPPRIDLHHALLYPSAVPTLMTVCVLGPCVLTGCLMSSTCCPAAGAVKQRSVSVSA